MTEKPRPFTRPDQSPDDWSAFDAPPFRPAVSGLVMAGALFVALLLLGGVATGLTLLLRW